VAILAFDTGAVESKLDEYFFQVWESMQVCEVAQLLYSFVPDSYRVVSDLVITLTQGRFFDIPRALNDQGTDGVGIDVQPKVKDAPQSVLLIDQAVKGNSEEVSGTDNDLVVIQRAVAVVGIVLRLHCGQ
jgi:hypothetical protein